jgi:hypothetical protein
LSTKNVKASMITMLAFLLHLVLVHFLWLI